jgi:hypothetical protein
MTGPVTSALVAEATKKAAVVWLSIDGTPAYIVWCVPIADALYVVAGPGEQTAPGLADATVVDVTARGDHGGSIATWSATVQRVDPGSDDWQTVALTVAGKRLNATGSADNLVAKWARDDVLVRLVPDEASNPDEAGSPDEASNTADT